ncbi:MAG TPA: hypothetical protein VMT03_16265 [Polyangia bacterium]|nr:hypothetical protein [Polyangia bacterium]
MTTRSRRLGVLAFAGALALGSGHERAWARPGPGPTARSAEPVRAFLRLELRAGGSAPREIYVGQTIPVVIRAYFLDGTGVSLTAQPHLTSDALTLSDLPDKPAQSTVQVRGFPYTMLTWTGRLTAARAGQERTDVALPVEISYRQPAPALPRSDQDSSSDDSENDANDPFSSFLKQTPLAKDPFFSRMFKGGDPFAGMMTDLMGTVRQRDLTLQGPGDSVRVLDLPAPQPAGFTGAVGNFEIAAGLSAGPYHVGEPATLRATVKGRGSLARLALDGVTSTPELTSYAVTAAGSPADTSERTFAQTLVPRQAGATVVPSLALVYFDPVARRYVTRRTAPIRIAVAAAAGPAGSSGTPASTGQPGDSALAPGLALAHPPGQPGVPDLVRPTLTPFIHTRRFPILLAAMGFVTAALALLGFLGQSGTLTRRRAARRLSREIAREQRALCEAVRRGDAAALFAAGRRALQARLAGAWGVPPEAIASTDVARRLGPSGDGIREVFDRADRLSYAGNRTEADLDLEPWPERISAELRALESRT